MFKQNRSSVANKEICIDKVRFFLVQLLMNQFLTLLQIEVVLT